MCYSTQWLCWHHSEFFKQSHCDTMMPHSTLFFSTSSFWFWILSVINLIVTTSVLKAQKLCLKPCSNRKFGWPGTLSSPYPVSQAALPTPPCLHGKNTFWQHWRMVSAGKPSNITDKCWLYFPVHKPSTSWWGMHNSQIRFLKSDEASSGTPSLSVGTSSVLWLEGTCSLELRRSSTRTPAGNLWVPSFECTWTATPCISWMNDPGQNHCCNWPSKWKSAWTHSNCHYILNRKEVPVQLLWGFRWWRQCKSLKALLDIYCSK